MWRRRYWWLALLAATVATVAVVQAVDAIAIVPDKSVISSCRKQVPLVPVELDGPPWQQHRHFLDAAIPFAPHTRHYMQDQQTGAIFRWPFVRTVAAAQSRFAVQTRWTWLNPDWKQRSWILFYDCSNG